MMAQDRPACPARRRSDSRHDQLAQEQPPEQPPQPPPPLWTEASPTDAEPVMAKVEKSARVRVPSQEGHTWAASRLAKPPKTSNRCAQSAQANS